MSPCFIKNLKATYLYNILNKELIYIIEARGELADIFIKFCDNVSKYLYGKNRFYLYQFFINDYLLSEDDYTTNLISSENLLAYINELFKVEGKSK